MITSNKRLLYLQFYGKGVLQTFLLEPLQLDNLNFLHAENYLGA
jgi:hypothetical protein